MGVNTGVRVCAVGLTAAALLGACSATSDAPATLPQLAVDTVVYDCAARKLVVTGTVQPAEANRNIQVQVRSVENPRAPVWRIVPTDSSGKFRAAGTYAVSEKKSVELSVRLASVAQGARIFSPRANQMVRCTNTK